jgi:hypothetical protein
MTIIAGLFQEDEYAPGSNIISLDCMQESHLVQKKHVVKGIGSMVRATLSHLCYIFSETTQESRGEENDEIVYF